MSILESVLNTTGSVEGKQDAFGKGLKTGLKEIYQKQEYMNRYLPKCKYMEIYLINRNSI